MDKTRWYLNFFFAFSDGFWENFVKELASFECRV